MKNNSSFTSITKNILLVLCLWFIGISVSNGQGWVKKYYEEGKINNLKNIFSYKDSLFVICEEIKIDTNDIYILKYDINGNLLKKNKIEFENDSLKLFTPYKIDKNGNILFYYFQNAISFDIRLLKINSNGIVIKDTTIIGNWDSSRAIAFYIFDTKANPKDYYQYELDDDFQKINQINVKNKAKGYSTQLDTGYIYIEENFVEFNDKNSNIIWKTYLPNNVQFSDCVKASNNEIIIYSPDFKTSKISFYKLDYNGVIIQSAENLIPIPNSGDISSVKIINNKIFFITYSLINNLLHNDLIVINNNFEIECNLINNLDISKRFNIISDLTLISNYYYLVGETGFFNGISKSQIAKISHHCDLFTNELQLKYFSDDDKNCIVNSNEKTLKDKLVNITDKDQIDNYFSSYTDTIFASLDTGNYVIHPIAPIYYKLCADSINIAHNQYYDTIKLDIPLQTVVFCPYLEVDISTPILRRCFNNTYSVHYCNQGTAIAKDAYVEVKLDKWLKYVSSTRPLSSQQGNILRYDLGDIPISDCGDFQIITYLDCDSTLLGQTHCIEAHIFPDSLCLPTNGWDGSRIRVSGQCVGDSIRFEIKNASNSPMLQQSEYIVVEDEIIMMQKPYQLGANESLRFNMPVFGRTYRLEAAQSVGHPGSSKPSVTIENCGVGPVSLGFVNQFHQDDADPFIDIDCQQNRGSYDPNDKQGFPTGYGKSHFVEQNQQIEYLIRFQNTGTDTAFTVRIHDTLSTHLDPTSFVSGASSHPYSYRIFDNGIIEFLFSAIALPDSNINKSGSIGFMKFTIAQRKDLPLGTEIKNRAAIYFDYNSPILTNTTIHTIGKNFITITEIPEINTSNLRIYPNPFSQEAVIEWEGNNIDDKIFELYDLQGRQLRKEEFTDNRLNFKRNQLQNGLYFFKITDKNGILTQGKMVVD